MGTPESVTPFEQASRRLAIFTTVCLYILGVIASIDDPAIVFNNDVVVLPGINSKLELSIFLAIVPLVVLVAYQYFQAGFKRALQTDLGRRNAQLAKWNSTSMFGDLIQNQISGKRELESAAAVVASYCVVWLLAPMTISVCWYRSLVVKHDPFLSCYSLIVLAIILVTSYKVFLQTHLPHQLVKITTSIIAIAVVLGMLVLTSALLRSVPAVCFGTSVRDLNHASFNNKVIEGECRERAGKHYSVLEVWSNLNLSQGAKLQFVTLGSAQGKDAVRPPVSPNLNLSNARAMGMAARSAYLVGATFIGSDFRLADFTDANLNRSFLLMTDFREAKLPLVGFIRSNMRYVDFDHAILDGAWFRGSNIYEGHFTGASMKGAHFDCTTFDHADFTGAKFDDADFSNTRLADSTISDRFLTDMQKKGLCIIGSAKRSAVPINSLAQCPTLEAWNALCKQDVSP